VLGLGQVAQRDVDRHCLRIQHHVAGRTVTRVGLFGETVGEIFAGAVEVTHFKSVTDGGCQ